jgi:hypothetical protein
MGQRKKYEESGIFVKFGPSGRVEAKADSIYKLAEMLNQDGVANIKRGLNLEGSVFKRFDSQADLDKYLRSGQQYAFAIEHIYTGNVYISEKSMSRATGLKSATLLRWAKEESHGLKRVRKTPVIYNTTLRGIRPREGNPDLYWDRIYPEDYFPSASIQTGDLDYYQEELKPFKPYKVVLVEEGEFTLGRKGQLAVLLTESVPGIHNCKLQFLDGAILYCRSEQIKKV